MSLLLEWEHEEETPQLLELALVNRLNTAYLLLTNGEWDASIYLFGYVGEMVLKTAYFRMRGNRLTDSVRGMLAPARRAGRLLIPGIEDENYHSLRFWSELLLAERRRADRALPVGTELELQYYSQFLYRNWMVEMRYHPNRATADNARDVAEAATWLFDNRAEIGS